MQLVVYKLKCDDCGAEYIGKTKRILSERIQSHKSHVDSAVFQTTQPTCHRVDFEGVVIDGAENDYKTNSKQNELKLIELQHIIKEKPELNKQLSSTK